MILQTIIHILQIFLRDSATRPDVDTIEVHAIDDEEEILFDGRIRRRENAHTELNLEGITLMTDEDGRVSDHPLIIPLFFGFIVGFVWNDCSNWLNATRWVEVSCELRKSVILERIAYESEDVEVFAVQKYAHSNLLRCLWVLPSIFWRV